MTLAVLMAVLVAGWVLLKLGLNYWLVDKFSQHHSTEKDQWVMIKPLFGLTWRLMQIYDVQDPKAIPTSSNDYFDYVGILLWCHENHVGVIFLTLIVLLLVSWWLSLCFYHKYKISLL